MPSLMILVMVAAYMAMLFAVAWRGDERFVYCSTFKMFLAAATFLRVRLPLAWPVIVAGLRGGPTREQQINTV